MTEQAGNWLRVSSGGQDERSQLPDNLKHCADKGYEIAVTYTVHGKSAYHGDQDPDWRRVVADVKSGRISVVVIWKVDRLDRKNILHAIPMVNAVLEAGGRIEFSSQSYIDLTTMAGRMAFANLCELAHEESRIKSDRITAKHNGLKAAGSFVGRPPYGYRIVKAGGIKTLEPDPVTSEHVRAMVSRYLAGDSLAAIANWLDSEKVPCSNSTCPEWDPAIIRKILGSETLIGRRRHGQDRKLLTFTPILDMAEWRKLQGALSANSRRRGPANRHPETLVGIAYCLTCGEPMHYRRLPTVRKDGSRYLWTGYRCDGRPKRPSVCRNMYPETEVQARLDEMFTLADVYEIAGKEITETAVIQPASHEDEMERLDSELTGLDWHDPDYQERHDAILRRLRELDSAKPEAARPVERGTGVTVGQLWGMLDKPQRRAYLAATGARLFLKHPSREARKFLEATGEDYADVVVVGDVSRITEALASILPGLDLAALKAA